MDTRQNLTQNDIKNIVASSILRKKEFKQEDVLKEVLEKLNFPNSFTPKTLKNTVKKCIENTITSLCLSNCYELKNGKFVLAKNAFLD